ncbi:MAG: hypothetical protein SNJ75_01360 [Gemmataceae bacterium]
MRALLLLLLLASVARAGLYFGDQRPQFTHWDRLREEVLKRRAVAVEPPGRLDPDSPRAQIQRLAKRLEIVQSQGLLSTPERVSLGAAYIRLGRLTEAIRLLEAGDRTHPLIVANLATAYFDRGEYDVAARHQSELLRRWPGVLPGWTQDDLARARAVERMFEVVIRNRAEEARRGSRRELPLDPLFPGFRVESAEGDYEPWNLPQSIRDRLPVDAEDTLMRLLLAVPHDRRLYWQFGELSAVLGRIEVAARVLNDLVDEGFEFQGLRRHRKILNEAATLMRAFTTRLPTFQFYATGMTLARVPLLPSASGHVLLASAWFAPLTADQFKTELEWELLRRAAEEGPAEVSAAELRGNPLDYWKHLAVSFAFGFLVAALIGFQIQEWRRRAQVTPSFQDSASSVK